MDGLPFDVIRLIMCELDKPYSHIHGRTAQMFALCSISRNWRSVALASPLLWSTIELNSQKNIRALPLSLRRSDPVPLRVTISLRAGGQHEPRVSEAFTLLAQNANRIYKLVVRRCDDEQIRTLFQQSVYPKLRKLQILSTGRWDPVTIPPFSAPNLMSVVLSRTILSDWSSISGSSLKRLVLQEAGDASVLLQALDQIHGLREIVFGSSLESPRPLKFLPVHIQALRYVKEVVLRVRASVMDTAAILTALSDAQALGNMETAEIVLPGGPGGPEMPIIMSQILQNSDTITSLDVSFYNFCFRTARCTWSFELLSSGPDQEWSTIFQSLRLEQLRSISFCPECRFAKTSKLWPELEEICIEYFNCDCFNRYNGKWSSKCKDACTLSSDVEKIILNFRSLPVYHAIPAIGLMLHTLRIIRFPVSLRSSRPIQICTSDTLFSRDRLEHAARMDDFRNLLSTLRLGNRPAVLCSHCDPSNPIIV